MITKLNKLSKSNSVSFRGSKNEELTKYGTEFDIVPHPSKDELFILKSKSSPAIETTGDENINIEDEDSELDFSLDDLSEDITEIDASFFKL